MLNRKNTPARSEVFCNDPFDRLRVILSDY